MGLGVCNQNRNMKQILFYFLALISLFDHTWARKTFTPLEIDNHPCTPENLKKTNRYICDSVGTVLCQTGWGEPDDDVNLRDMMNPCPVPKCEHNNKGCVHGECRSPDFCACEIGWEGTNCDICIPLPGCEHGTCTNALECDCDDNWYGAYCEIPTCDDCVNGRCLEPNDCICFDGYFGDNCTQCKPLPNCLHGTCGDHPNTCECNPQWEGHLCDVPTCDPACGEHGVCAEGDPAAGVLNFCICETGWKGKQCDECVPYWDCPIQDETACTRPNECICPDPLPVGTTDPNGVCGHADL